MCAMCIDKSLLRWQYMLHLIPSFNMNHDSHTVTVFDPGITPQVKLKFHSASYIAMIITL